MITKQVLLATTFIFACVFTAKMVGRQSSSAAAKPASEPTHENEQPQESPSPPPLQEVEAPSTLPSPQVKDKPPWVLSWERGDELPVRTDLEKLVIRHGSEGMALLRSQDAQELWAYREYDDGSRRVMSFKLETRAGVEPVDGVLQFVDGIHKRRAPGELGGVGMGPSYTDQLGNTYSTEAEAWVIHPEACQATQLSTRRVYPIIMVGKKCTPANLRKLQWMVFSSQCRLESGASRGCVFGGTPRKVCDAAMEETGWWTLTGLWLDGACDTSSMDSEYDDSVEYIGSGAARDDWQTRNSLARIERAIWNTATIENRTECKTLEAYGQAYFEKAAGLSPTVDSGHGSPSGWDNAPLESPELSLRCAGDGVEVRGASTDGKLGTGDDVVLVSSFQPPCENCQRLE